MEIPRYDEENFAKNKGTVSLLKEPTIPSLFLFCLSLKYNYLIPRFTRVAFKRVKYLRY